MDAERFSNDVIARFGAHVNPYLARLLSFAGMPVEDHAEGVFIWDHEGKRYLDCLGGYGVFSVGHRHPRVLEAVREQVEEMPLGAKAFFSAPCAELAERLSDVAPEGLQYTFFSNSGTEAVEAALKFARATTGRSRFVATIDGYHGKTLGSLSVTGREKYQAPFRPLLADVEFVAYGDAEALGRAVDERTAAVILEPVQGEGGVNIPPEGYLRAARAACDRAGALFIADEVQTGLGRTGRMFACTRDSVAPDLMCLAKALGGGVMPIGATMFTQRVCDAVFSANPLAHTSTFGGNALACAAGIATLDVIRDEGLIERSERVGNVLREALTEATRGQSDLIAGVRGLGLMIGVEFTQDEVGELAIAQMVKRGLLAAYMLNNPRVIRFEPPLVLDEEQAHWAARTFAEAVAETAEILAMVV